MINIIERNTKMEKEMKLLFEDILHKTKLSGLGEVLVNSTDTTPKRIYIVIDYPKPAPDEDRPSRRSAYLQFNLSLLFSQKESIKDVPINKILEIIENFDFRRTTGHKNQSRPNEIWLIKDSDTVELEKSSE